MAAIEQVIRIATNRANAENDVYVDLNESSRISYTNASGTSANLQIHNNHLNVGTSSGQLLEQGSAVVRMIPDPQNPGSMIPDPDGTLASDTRYATIGVGASAIVREGTGDTAVVREGVEGTSRVLRVQDINHANANYVTYDSSTGDIVFSDPTTLQLGSVHTFDNITFRNQGIESGSTTANSTIRWHQGDLAIVLADQTEVPDPNDANNPLHPAGDAANNGTYIYTGQDQSAFGTTDADDWTLLLTGTSSVTDVSTIFSNTTGLISNQRGSVSIPVAFFRQDTGTGQNEMDGTTESLQSVVFNGDTRTLTINGSSITLGTTPSVQRRRWTRTDAVSEGSDAINITLSRTEDDNAGQPVLQWAPVGHTTAFPTTPLNTDDVQLFANGLRLVLGVDWEIAQVNNMNTTTITVMVSGAARNLINTDEEILFELEQISLTAGT